MKLTRKLAGAGAAVALTLTGLAATAGPAQAAAYNGACGTGYRVIDSMSVGGSGTGTAYLTYNNGWNCVVTVSNTPGQRDWMKASIELSSAKGGGWIDDEDYYTKYAGPVYVYAPSACIDWGGTVGYKGSIWLQWNDHCG
ncbi:spore-associated protein A [Actinoplanes sp. ATCC 53533]|uniref:spore-associated protein A n=1 Tax=Actinoplanes sp. ATCC 53533 TaxID=1288362 RepID=UPI000F76DB58|nr:spore-associated protein A [Actinoplanes sp. ATCC 53533]RSM74233.1 spore-associated protein A [Actinoplanes sp. ATCC 53533]